MKHKRNTIVRRTLYMFCYYLYGKHVVINVELPLLCNIADYNKVDLTVHVDFDIITGETINIKKDYERYIIELGSLAYYCVDPTKNIIICKAANFESFFSTFFNIPFSVYFLCKDEILYHACSLIYDNIVFCLTGNKGVGKSTITEILNSKNEFQIFSDDTIHIDNNFFSNSAHNLVKHTPETVEFLKLKTLNVKNAAGKYYSTFDKHYSLLKINKIFHLIRTDNKLAIRPINNILIKNSVFRANIVGINYMPYPLISKVLKINPSPNIDFYELLVPNDLNSLIKNSDKLKQLIVNCFEMGVKL